MTVIVSSRRFIGAAIVGMMVIASGEASAQSVQRSTEQPLGAAGVLPQPSSPASPLATGPVTTGSGETSPAKPGTSNPSPQRFTSEAAARTACGSQPVVWVNTRSKKFFASGTKLYGKTRNGTFMCRDTAAAGGFSAAKS